VRPRRASSSVETSSVARHVPGRLRQRPPRGRKACSAIVFTLSSGRKFFVHRAQRRIGRVSRPPPQRQARPAPQVVPSLHLSARRTARTALRWSAAPLAGRFALRTIERTPNAGPLKASSGEQPGNAIGNVGTGKAGSMWAGERSPPGSGKDGDPARRAGPPPLSTSSGRHHSLHVPCGTAVRYAGTLFAIGEKMMRVS
jgi:hypothetical protein